MQHVLVVSKKRLVQGCKNAVAHSRPKMWNARTFFYLLYFMHMNAVWQSLYVCATKNCWALLTFTEDFAPLVFYKILINALFVIYSLDDAPPWMSGASPRSSPLYTTLLVTTLCKFYRCLKAFAI